MRFYSNPHEHKTNAKWIHNTGKQIWQIKSSNRFHENKNICHSFGLEQIVMLCAQNMT